MNFVFPISSRSHEDSCSASIYIKDDIMLNKFAMKNNIVICKPVAK